MTWNATALLDAVDRRDVWRLPGAIGDFNDRAPAWWQEAFELARVAQTRTQA